MKKSTHWALTFHGYGWSTRILLFSESRAVNIGQFIHSICSTVDYSQRRGPLFEPCAINTTRKLDSTVMLVNRIWKGQGFWSRIPAPFSRESLIPSFYHRHPEYCFLGVPESGKILLMESEILAFVIRNTAQGIRNPTDDWNPESIFY